MHMIDVSAWYFPKRQFVHMEVCSVYMIDVSAWYFPKLQFVHMEYLIIMHILEHIACKCRLLTSTHKDSYV